MARAALILSVVVAALLGGCGSSRPRSARASSATVAAAATTMAAAATTMAAATTTMADPATVAATATAVAPVHRRARESGAQRAGPARRAGHVQRAGPRVGPPQRTPAQRATPGGRSPAFVYRAAPLSTAMRALMRGRSWHPGCPVGLGALRYVRVGYWDFARRPRVGGMVVNASAVAPLRRVFSRLYAARFPIRRMRPVDVYRGSDYASIQADNTSSFNCRDTTGATTWSQHAYGLAVDIDPIENPYVYTNGTTTHPASRPYLNRHDVRPGMAVAGGTLVRAFDAIGWGWGGRWPLPTDYQHFSANGR
jgi:D-alanyl-D-alanine carboxypeptidase